MPGSTYIPSREVDLLNWSHCFDARINEDPQAIGLNSGQAATYSAAHVVYQDAYRTAQEPNTRTRPAILGKNDAKKALLVEIRKLVPIIQAFPGTTNEMRAKLGITVRDPEPTPVPRPRSGPSLTVLHTVGRVVKVRLRDVDSPDRRGKPDGVIGALVFMYVGDNAPDNQTEWTLLANATRTVFDLHFGGSVEAGARIWLCARWYNTKAVAGPASSAKSVRISDGMAKAA